MAALSITPHFPQLPSTKCLVGRARIIHGRIRKSVFTAQHSTTAAAVSSPQIQRNGVGVVNIGASLASMLAHVRRSSLEMRSMPVLAEIAIDQAIISCRFFAVIAVVGSLIGSILCFVEGSFLMIESYFEGFHIISQKLDQGQMIHMAIEAIDMFLIGTVMLSFGMGLYSMFIGFNRNRGLVQGSFHHKMLSDTKMNSMSQAKSKLGHAVVMLLQVGVVEKFKNVPLVSGLDLACFAGALFFSSASIFLLSRLRTSTPERNVSDHRKCHSMNTT